MTASSQVVAKPFRALFLLILMFALTLGTAFASASSQSLSTVSFSEPQRLLAPMSSAITIFDGAAGVEDGQDVLYTSTKGSPSIFSVIGLDDYKLLRSFEIPGVSESWHHEVAADGTVYIAAAGSLETKLWTYSPVTKEIKGVAKFPNEGSLWSLTTDENSNAYVGSFPGGRVYNYDASTGALRDYGRMVGSQVQEYVRSIAYHDGFIYAGTNEKRIFKLNAATGEKVDIATAPILDGQESFVYDLDVAGNYLFARFSKSLNMFVYDLAAQQWLDVKIANVTGLHVPKALDGKTYFIADRQLKSFDLVTHEISSTGMPYGSGLRGADYAQIDDPDLPGTSLVTIQFGGSVTFFNLETKRVKVFPPVVAPAASTIQAVELGPDGRIFTSGYISSIGGIYNPSDGTNVNYTIGQADTLYPLNGKMYMGVYPNGFIHAYDAALPPGNANPRQLFQIGDEQDRVNAFTSGDGKLYVGTIPYYGKLGGAITEYDPAAGTHQVYRNVVEGQSITGLAYHNGKIYGTTSIYGGLGIDPSAAEAKVFVWDAVTKEKIAEFTPELEGPAPKFIGGISIGTDGNVWAAANGSVFAFNPETYEIVKSKNLYPEVTNYGMWKPVKLYWSNGGLLYINVASNLNVVDPETLNSRFIIRTETFTLGKDGHIYYQPLDKKTELYRIQVSIAAEDVNEDGKVNGTDVSKVAQNFREQVTEDTLRYDVNRDGKIDHEDVKQVNSAMGN